MSESEESVKFRAIAASFTEMIISKKIAVGEKLPAYGSIAKAEGVSIGVVQDAMKLLRDAGLIESRPGKGTVVISAVPIADDEPQKALNRAMAARLDALEKDMAVLKSLILRALPPESRTPE